MPKPIKLTDEQADQLNALLALCAASSDPAVVEAATKVKPFGSGEESPEGATEPPGDQP